MVITLNNANNDFLEVLKSILKFTPDIEMSVKKDSKKNKIDKIVSEFEAEKKAGKTKIYKNTAEYLKAING